MESTSGQSEKVPKNSNSDSKEGSHDTVKKSSGKKQSESAPKKFAILSTDCIKVIADSCGISELSEDVAPALAEDASYKLREVIHYCSIYWKNTKRKKLMVEDVSRVFNVLNVPTIHGHSDENETEFIRVPSSDVFITNDADQDVVSIATSDKELAPYKEPYIRGTWLIAEPFEPPGENKDNKQKETNANAKPGTSSETATSGVKTPAKAGGKPDDPPGASRPPPHLLNYYLQVAKVIISGSTYLLEVAINDLRTNPNVGPVCPYFLNLVALSVNKLQRHAWLTDALLSTVKALVENQFVDPSCYLAANRAANSLLVIAIEPKIASNCDDLLLRSRAAELLSKVLFTWTIEMKQQMDIVRQLLQLLLDKNISLQSQYGAIVCLISLGYRILLMYFWPVMERYFPLLEEKYKTSSSADIAHVKGAILAAAEVMYRKDWDVCTPEEAKRRLRIDYLLYDYFGDSSIPRRQQYSNERTIYPNKSSNVTGDTSKTESNLVVMDYDFDYQNWNPSYMIQRKPYMQNTNPYIRKNRELPATDINTVFETTSMVDRTNNIIFNFVGSNQINNDMLKKKKLDPKQITFDSSSHKLTGLWYKQNIYKNTRTTKYCVKWHTKCSTGDLFTIL